MLIYAARMDSYIFGNDINVRIDSTPTSAGLFDGMMFYLYFQAISLSKTKGRLTQSRRCYLHAESSISPAGLSGMST